ncbi:DNA ligase (NAD(+)) LigA [bacterium]|nr:MAG: DNA ligase (NAD(+)) LigA [bacterium]
MEEKEKILSEIKKLRREIERHNYLYYVLSQPEISDAEYDALFDRLKELESKYPEFDDENSPTHRVGAEPAKEFPTVEHITPLLSLDKATTYEEFLEFHNRVLKFAGANDLFRSVEYTATPKLDGLSIRLRYENGALMLGATRGDGFHGEDITQNIRTIRNLPHYLLDEAENLSIIEFRGEVVIHKNDFKKLNDELEANGEKKFVSARNAAAGSLRQLDPKITAKRPLRAYIYEILYCEGKDFKNHWEQLAFIRDVGLPVVPEAALCPSTEEVKRYFERAEKNRENLPFETDGVVIKVNDIALQEKMGLVSHHPRWAIAWKFSAEEVITTLIDVQWNVTRNGFVTPVAIMEPVFVAGATISRATLHNEDQIAKLGIKIGDKIVIRRAGDVIPEVIRPLPELRTGNERDIIFPKNCPVCGAPLFKLEDDIYRRCPNKSCPAVIAETIKHFVSRKAFDIEGIGDKQVETLLGAGLIRDAADLFLLEPEQLIPLERWGKKLAEKVVANIQARKKIPLDRFIYALGIPGVGSHLAEVLAHNFRSIDALKNASFDELVNINEIGPATAESIIKFFGDEHNERLLKKMKKLGIEIESPAEEATEQKPLAGKTFVFTGTLSSMSRSEAEKLVKKLGGKASSSVSKKTDFVVVGENPGSKYQKAIQLGIKILSEEEFFKFVEQLSNYNAR